MADLTWIPTSVLHLVALRRHKYLRELIRFNSLPSVIRELKDMQKQGKVHPSLHLNVRLSLPSSVRKYTQQAEDLLVTTQDQLMKILLQARQEQLSCSTQHLERSALEILEEVKVIFDATLAESHLNQDQAAVSMINPMSSDPTRTTVWDQVVLYVYQTLSTAAELGKSKFKAKSKQQAKKLQRRLAADDHVFPLVEAAEKVPLPDHRLPAQAPLSASSLPKPPLSNRALSSSAPPSASASPLGVAALTDSVMPTMTRDEIQQTVCSTVQAQYQSEVIPAFAAIKKNLDQLFAQVSMLNAFLNPTPTSSNPTPSTSVRAFFSNPTSSSTTWSSSPSNRVLPPNSDGPVSHPTPKSMVQGQIPWAVTGPSNQPQPMERKSAPFRPAPRLEGIPRSKDGQKKPS
jgi:hypothetical protein